jgi:nucleoside-diphosphate-sugar epimerase
VQTVFHLASVHLDVRARPDEFEAVNVRAVDGLVTACAKAGVRRLVHTSSVGIYGHVAAPPAREDSPKNPETPYEKTKLEGEVAALRRAAEVGLEIIVVRPAWVYGPGCPRTAKLLRAVRNGRFVYIGDGSNLRHPVFIDDMVDAYLLAAAAPSAAAGKAYVIGGPRSMALRELVETSARVLEVRAPRLTVPRALARLVGLGAELAYGTLGKEPPFSRRSLAFFVNDNSFDITAAARDLGFVPKIDFEEGLRRTVDEAGGAVAA